MKLAVVPEGSERWTGMMSASGSATPEFSAVIAGSFHFVIWPRKILAVVSPSSFSLVTPDRLYDSVIGPATVGNSSVAPPWYLEASAAGGATSVPAKSTRFACRSVCPLPDPPELVGG